MAAYQKSLFDRSDDDGEEGASSPDLFALYKPEYEIIQRLIQILQRILGQIPMTPQQVLSIAKLLLFLRRLPKTTPGIDLRLAVVYEHNREHTYSSIAVEEHYLTLESGGSICSEEVSHDNYTDANFQFGTHGFRYEESPDWLYPQILRWFESFDDLLGFPCKVDIDDINKTLELPWDDLVTPKEWYELALDYNPD